MRRPRQSLTCAIYKPTKSPTRSALKPQDTPVDASRKEYYRAYYQRRKVELLAKAAENYARDKDPKLEYQREYYQKNKVARNKKAAEYTRKRLETDPIFKMIASIRHRIYNAVAMGGYTKKSKTTEILGCDFSTFKTHIEGQFQPGMSWENHGEWHFDHTTPASWATSEEEVIALNHYTNFKPMWAAENLAKGNRYGG